MGANFVQVSGPGGRFQSFTPGTSLLTWIWNPASLKGSLPGGDLIYADRIRFHVTGQITRNATVGDFGSPNWEALAQQFGQLRVYSQFCGEMVNKSQNSVPLLMNHDSMFHNGFGPSTRIRGMYSGSAGQARAIEYEFQYDFKRSYLERPTDSCPWLGFLEGGIIEVDLMPATALNSYGWTATGTWTMDVEIDWFPDRTPLIHAPIQPRLYRVTTSGPEFLLRGLGAPAGLDGVVQGSRLALLSWLGSGTSNSNHTSASKDNGFYAAFGGSGGVLFGTNGLSRLDVPFRDQVSIDAVSAWISSFLAETTPIRHRTENPAGLSSNTAQNDLAGWPFAMDPSLTTGQQSYIADSLDFFPLVWPGPYDKIADMQKVDGDLSFTATLNTPPAPSLQLFRTDEVCSFTSAKVMDLMERMGFRHKDRGGRYAWSTKYAGAKRADDTTQWGMPLQIVEAA